MNLEVFEQGHGRILITHDVPEVLSGFIIGNAVPVVLSGQRFQALLQEFRGEGFHAWFNRVWAREPFVLHTRGDIAVLELRVAWRHHITGSWDAIAEPGLPPQYFQLAFTPYIETKAIFAGAVEYQTFDVHFTLPYLQSFGLDYQLMDRFIRCVEHRQAAELAAHPYPCNRPMLQLIHMLLDNDYSLAGRRRLMAHHIASILTTALEIISREEGVQLPLTQVDKTALYAIRALLNQAPVDIYPGNHQLLRHVRPHLNTFKLNYGFQQLFHISPEEYFLRRRFDVAKHMLSKGLPIGDVATAVGYESATTFGKQFRRRFGMSAREWKRREI